MEERERIIFERGETLLMNEEKRAWVHSSPSTQRRLKSVTRETSLSSLMVFISRACRKLQMRARGMSFTD